MKILFVTIHFLPQENSNICIVDSLCKYLSSKGESVHILTLKNRLRLKKKQIMKDYTVHRFEMSIAKRVIRICRNYLRIKDTNWNDALTNRILKLNLQYEFDVIVPVHSGLSVLLPTLSAFQSCSSKLALVPYFLDPLSTHQESSWCKTSVFQIEKELYSNCAKAIVTEEMYDETRKSILSHFQSKLVPIKFPNVRPFHKEDSPDDIYFDRDFVNCSYIGTLNSAIRDARFILEMFSKSTDSKIRLNIVGETIGENKYIEIAKSILHERLIVHGKVSAQAAENAIINSDVLINIGNCLSNMVPSKIFDYFSSGRPVVSTYKRHDCPSLKHTQKYPLCLNLFEGQPITEQLVTEFENFCLEKRYEHVEYKKVAELFRENTLEYVGEQFLNILKDALIEKDVGIIK